jgi:hypothetical protein
MCARAANRDRGGGGPEISKVLDRPDHQGVPLTRWSQPRLAIHLADEGIVEVSFGYLGRLLASEFVVCNADYLDWDAFAFALARHVTYRNGDHRDRRLAAAETRHRIAA